jgi:hypothetical protein
MIETPPYQVTATGGITVFNGPSMVVIALRSLWHCVSGLLSRGSWSAAVRLEIRRDPGLRGRAENRIDYG